LIWLQAIDAGALDVEIGGDVIEVYTDFKQLAAVRQALLAAGLPVTGAEKMMLARTTVAPETADALKAMRLIERLEDLDDVQKVYSNLEITEELAEQFESQ
jgi:transcriptional/translational regulatory protein YebC/TACO1